MTLGEYIKEYRKVNDLTMDDFAKKSAISKAYISMLEKNKHPQNGRPITPTLDTCKKAANAMGVSLNDLLARLDQDEPKQLADQMKNQVPQLEGVYLSFAKQAQDEGIDPDDIMKVLEILKGAKKK